MWHFGFIGTTFFYFVVGYLSMIVWTPVLLGVLYACVLCFCICTCSAQLSIFHTEKRSRNTLIIITIIIFIITIIIIIIIIITKVAIQLRTARVHTNEIYPFIGQLHVVRSEEQFMTNIQKPVGSNEHR